MNLELRPFSPTDWMGFAGAAGNPLIATSDTDQEEGGGAIVVVDTQGVGVFWSNADGSEEAQWFAEEETVGGDPSPKAQLLGKLALMHSNRLPNDVPTLDRVLRSLGFQRLDS